MMRKNREAELEKLENWDVEKAEVMQPVKTERHVVSVSLKHDEFERISEYAASCGKKLSQFIRDATIEKTLPVDEHTVFASLSGGLGTQWAMDQLSNFTIVEGPQVDIPEETNAITI